MDLITRDEASLQVKSERGQILVMFALGLIVFLGFAALTIDIGFLLVTQRSYQNAADASALAGATYLTRPTSDPCAEVAGGGSKHDCARAASWTFLRDDLGLALTDADINTLKLTSTTIPGGEVAATIDGGDDYRVWVSTPPSGAGVHSSMSTVRDNKQVVFVRVDRLRHTFVGGILGLTNFNVSAWATAGTSPDRYAVITLRRGDPDTGEVDPGPANTTDIRLAGTNSELRVVDGDIGGNWGMKLTAGSKLTISSSIIGGDQYNVRLKDWESCGNSCWTYGQVVNGNTSPPTPMDPVSLGPWIQDPDYQAPPGLGSAAPDGPVDNPGTTPDIPRSPSTPATGPDRDDVVVKNSDLGSVSGTGCSADSPVLGPGWVEDISVAGGHCLILRGDVVRTDMFDPLTESPVPMTQMPGILYVTGSINVGNSALIVADGVTIVMRPDGSNGQFSPNSGGVMDLNRGKSNPLGVQQRLGGWTTEGISTYDDDDGDGDWEYDADLEDDPRLNGVGIAFYVLRADQVGYSLGGGTNVIAVNSGAGLAWTGVTYAPNDNVQIAGQPDHDGIGQLISWTFTFNGGTIVTQTFDGPGDGFPYLIEPCIQVSGACQ